jgi:hypothetical protein
LRTKQELVADAPGAGERLSVRRQLRQQKSDDREQE